MASEPRSMPQAHHLGAHRGRLRLERHPPLRPALTAHQIADDRVGAPVGMGHHRRIKAVAQRSARDAADKDGRMARLQDEVVDVWDGADDTLAEHVWEAPAARLVTDWVPLGQLGTIWQPRELRLAAGALGAHDARDARELAALAE